MAFIVVNHVHSTMTNAAFLIIALIIPNTLPARYKGIKIFVAGFNTVYVRIALALINSVASAISQKNATLLCL